MTIGDKVTTGQVLATLNSTSLRYALATAQQQVANARLTLWQAESGQASAASGTTSSKTSSSATGSSSAAGSTAAATKSGSSHSGAGSTAGVTAAQKRILAAVHQVESALAKAKADLALATTRCQSLASSAPSPSPSPSSSSLSPSWQSRSGGPSPVLSGTAAPLAASNTCMQIQQLVLRDESHLFTLQQGLSGQETALDKLLAAASSAGTSSAGKASTGTTSAGTTPAVKASGGAGSGGSTTVAVSAAQLAADQAALDAATASLAVAQQQLNQATIVSPFTGVVVSVGLTIGQQATAGSSTTAVDVIDPTGHGVTLSVDVTKIPQVKVGQKATVVPDGSATPLAATVSYVAAAPATTGSTVYPVQLTFTGNPTSLRNGIQAAVTITTAQAGDPLAVPTSAVNHLGTRDYVLVLNGSSTKAQVITVGAVGAIYTQVTGGLTAGLQVVLANPNQPIPTSTITGRIARITGGATNTTGVLGGSIGASGSRPGG